MKKLLDGDSQTITQLFDGGNGGAVIPSADNVVDGRLGDAAETAQLIDGNIPLPAQLQNPRLYRFTDVHGHHLTS